MCTTQKSKKRFDYDAYIQGRLIGKYVVIYHDEIPVEPEINTSEVEELQPVAQPLIVIKPDDILELSGMYVYPVTLNQSCFYLGAVYTDEPKFKSLAMYKGCLLLVKPAFPNSRAGPY